MGYTAGNIAARTKAAKATAAAWNIDGFTASTTNGCTAIVAPAATIEDAALVIALVELTHTIRFAKFVDARQVVEITAIAGNSQAVR
jgi:hypothetical protein